MAKSNTARASEIAQDATPIHVTIYPGMPGFEALIRSSLANCAAADDPLVLGLIGRIVACRDATALRSLGYAMRCLGMLADHRAVDGRSTLELMRAGGEQ